MRLMRARLAIRRPLPSFIAPANVRFCKQAISG